MSKFNRHLLTIFCGLLIVVKINIMKDRPLELIYTFTYRLRAASILLVGLNGYGAEVAKNIILAGVKTVTFLDHRPATAQDACSQFFIPKDQLGKNVSVL